MSDKIKKAYKQSKNIYDDVLTQESFFSKMYIKFFWSGVDDNKMARNVLEYIPKDFSGKLLDVPVGTGVFTYETYFNLKNAEITCLDYSEDMLEKANKRFEGMDNIKTIQGDVGNLPFQSENFDIVLSMNGFHAFPDKSKAYSEITRVLKKDGILIALYYIKGENSITDWLVRNILSRKGWFTPDFQTRDMLLKDLKDLSYKIEEINIEGSMVYFCARKR